MGAFSIGQIIARLLALFDEYRRKRESKLRQAERDALERDPAGWFSEHFDDGLHDTEAADSTDKTEPHNRGEG